MFHPEILTLTGEKLCPTQVTAKEIAAYVRSNLHHEACATAPLDEDGHCTELHNAQAACRFSYAKAFETADLNLCQVQISTPPKRSPSFEKVKLDEPRAGIEDSTEW